MKTLVLGGGIVGLSIAYEMSRRGHAVTLLDRGPFAAEASYAGAGIIVPANEATARHPIEHMMALSYELHAEWSRRLLEETGIDNGYHVGGGLHLARTIGDVASLSGAVEEFRVHDIRHEELTLEEAAQVFPSLKVMAESERPRRFVWLPDEAQFHNPLHNDALIAACQGNGVEMLPGVKQLGVRDVAGRVVVDIEGVAREADRICVAAGAWTEQVLSPLGIKIPTVPVRGQVSLFRLPEAQFQCVVYEGSWYLVPRRDGHVLVGATIEEAGFDPTTTDRALEELQSFAIRLVPDLVPERKRKSWAGLRPASFDGMPFMGSVSGFENLFVAAGHFKSGLQLSPGTAVVMSDLMEGETHKLDLTPFSPDRVHV